VHIKDVVHKVDIKIRFYNDDTIFTENDEYLIKVTVIDAGKYY